MPTPEQFAARTCDLLRASALHMACLQAARELALPDWYLAAGFVRNLIWDHLHGYAKPTALNDIDLIYLDSGDPDGSDEPRIEMTARSLLPLPWEVRNQARMHLRQGVAPFIRSAEALSRWVELPTCVGVRLLDNDELELCAPYGLVLNWSLAVAPNPQCLQPPAVFSERVERKRWQQIWPKLKVHWPAP